MSLTKMSSALLGSSKAPWTMRAPRSSSMKDAAAPSRRTSQQARASRSMASAKARASAAAAMWTPHRSWLTSLTFWPSPGSVPTTGALRAIASSSGRTRSTAAAAPLTMISRSPSPARATPPDTGASTTSTSAARRRSAQACTCAGPTVAVIRTVAPGVRAEAASPAPNSTSSTSAGVATVRTRTSAAAAPATVSTRDPPSAVRPGSTSNPATSCPARATLAAIGAPMAPRPIHPTRVMRSVSGETFGLVLAQEALEQAPVALLVAQDRDHHVVGHRIDLLGRLDDRVVVLDRAGLGLDHALDDVHDVGLVRGRREIGLLGREVDRGRHDAVELLDPGRELLGVPELLLDVLLEGLDDLLGPHPVRVDGVGDVVDHGLHLHPVGLREQHDDLLAGLGAVVGEDSLGAVSCQSHVPALPRLRSARSRARPSAPRAGCRRR